HRPRNGVSPCPQTAQKIGLTCTNTEDQPDPGPTPASHPTNPAKQTKNPRGLGAARRTRLGTANPEPRRTPVPQEAWKRKELTVGQVAQRSGVAVSALHFYERQGLIRSRRTAGNQRRYTRDTLRRLAFIRVSQRVAIPPARIRTPLHSLPD